jgi:hypothetical protein
MATGSRAVGRHQRGQRRQRRLHGLAVDRHQLGADGPGGGGGVDEHAALHGPHRHRQQRDRGRRRRLVHRQRHQEVRVADPREDAVQRGAFVQLCGVGQRAEVRPLGLEPRVQLLLGDEPVERRVGGGQQPLDVVEVGRRIRDRGERRHTSSSQGDST